MSHQINVTMSINPPGGGSGNYTASCSVNQDVDQDCTIYAHQGIDFFLTETIKFTIANNYTFDGAKICVAKPTNPPSACLPANTIWQPVGLSLKTVILTAKPYYYGDLKYTLYVKDMQQSLPQIPIDPMIHNGIRPVDMIVIAVLGLGLAAFSVFLYNRLWLRRARQPAPPS